MAAGRVGSDCPPLAVVVMPVLAPADGPAQDALVDLSTRTVIHDLVVGFYRELVLDDLLAPVFVEVAEVDWSEHIPLLIDYWCRILLSHDGYQGAILAAHRHVHDQQTLTAEHFDRWYSLWVATIDAGWSGPYAEEAKRHAAKIGGTLARRVASILWTPPPTPSEEPVEGAASSHRHPGVGRNLPPSTTVPQPPSDVVSFLDRSNLLGDRLE